MQIDLNVIREKSYLLKDKKYDYYLALNQAIDEVSTTQDYTELRYLLQLRDYPVSLEEFITNPFYMNKKKEEFYEEVMKELIILNNHNGKRVINPYSEAVFTGGIGSAKSTSALYTTAYQLYILSCFRRPHLAFNLDVSSEIAFIFQSVSSGTAVTVDYTRFYEMVKASPYFNTVFPFDKRKKSKLVFPNRIEVYPLGSDHGSIGQNIMGGIIDEVNFMQVIENSKRTRDSGVYDQATVIYDSIARRRKTRFIEGEKSAGILCLVSSKRYPGEFTDKKLEEAKTDPTIYVYDKRVWDVKPKGTFKGYFPLYTGDGLNKPKILTEEEAKKEDPAYVMRVPNFYRREFEKDLVGAVRDIAGVSTLARYPYFSDSESVVSSFGAVNTVLSDVEVDFSEKSISIYPQRFKNIERPRWVHIDLGVTNDSAGIACGYVDSFKLDNHNFPMPCITFDFTLRVKPPKNGEIKFSKIRDLIIKCRQLGLPIKWVSFDSFQSVDSIQILRQMGFSAGTISMDKSLEPYNITRSAFYENRVRSPIHQKVIEELLSLEFIAQKGKVDHPPAGSKDVSDAMAGVIFNLVHRREVWSNHGVKIHQHLLLKNQNVKTEGE